MEDVLRDKEWLRLEAISVFEADLYAKGFAKIAGVDEVGRGPLAGPVVASACILPKNYKLNGINDSKKLTKEAREALYKSITSDQRVLFKTAFVDVETIDEINILQASLLAMKKAVHALSVQPDYLLIDGVQAPDMTIPIKCVIKGDSHSISIAAASIIAKCERDWMMEEFHKEYPEYCFNEHKGYATKKHYQAIEKYGPCPIHRKSFEPIRSLLQPDLPL